MDDARRIADNYLETLDTDTGKPPQSRLKDAKSLREIWERLNNADQTGSFNRSLVRQLVNGHPPFDQATRDEEGQGDLFNVNTGNARLIVDESTSAIMDIFSSERNMVELPLDRAIPDEQRFSVQRQIEDEFSRMLREWDCFLPRVNNLCHTFVTDGISILFQEDDENWYFNSCGLKDVRFPRYVEPVASKIPLAVIRRNIHIGALWRHIEDEEAAVKKGWNPETVREAIKKGTCKNRVGSAWRDWESLEQDLKNNEMYVSSVADPVEVLYAFVEEFDGSVSLCIGTAATETDMTVNDFLYKRTVNYKSMNEVMQVFPYSTGGDTDALYSVRGMGYFVYQGCNAENIMFCKLMDAARVSASPIYQPRTPGDLEDASFQDMGIGLMLPPGIDIATQAQPPNLTQNLVPAMQAIRDSLQRVSGGLVDGPNAMGERANEATVSYSLEQLNKMNSFAIALFYPPLDRAWREVARRVFIEDLDTPESLAMKDRLRKRGITEEFWRRIDLPMVRSRRILAGAGKTGRTILLNQARQLYGSLDEQGRKELDYDTFSNSFGSEAADRYVGRVDQTRTTYHEWIAELEAYHLIEGAQIEAKDGQDHLAHLRTKIQFLLAGKDGVENGTLELSDYVLKNLPLWENCQGHLAMLVVDPTLQQEAALMRQQLQRLGELFANGIKEIQANQRKGKAAQNGAQQGGEEQELSPLELQLREENRKDVESEASIRRKNAESAANLALKKAEKDVELALKIKERAS